MISANQANTIIFTCVVHLHVHVQHSPLKVSISVGRVVRSSLCCHDNEMVQKEAPGVQTVAKAVDLWLFEGVLGEESEKLQDRKLRIKLHPLKV